jgi:hypothetical protein
MQKHAAKVGLLLKSNANITQILSYWFTYCLIFIERYAPGVIFFI